MPVLCTGRWYSTKYVHKETIKPYMSSRKHPTTNTPSVRVDILVSWLTDCHIKGPSLKLAKRPVYHMKRPFSDMNRSPEDNSRVRKLECTKWTKCEQRIHYCIDTDSYQELSCSAVSLWLHDRFTFHSTGGAQVCPLAFTKVALHQWKKQKQVLMYKHSCALTSPMSWQTGTETIC